MRLKRRARRAVLASLLACCAFALFNVAVARAQQPEGQRRPRGVVAGPAIKLPRGEGANADQSAKDEIARAAVTQKWEYCAITGFNWRQKGFSLSAPHVPVAIVRYFPSTVEEIEGTNEEDAIANAFARLGEEGWELTGVKSDINLNEGNGKTTTTYFFKRPKRSE